MTRRRYDAQSAIDARVNEIEAHRGAPVDPPVTFHGPGPVCLTKRATIDAAWVERHRTTAGQRQKIADELRAVYGPAVHVSFGGAS